MNTVKVIPVPFEKSLTNWLSDFMSEAPSILNTGFNQVVTKHFAPLNVIEKDSMFEIQIIAPGFEKSDFNVHIENSLLTITTNKNSELKNENEKHIRKEYSFNNIKRTLTLDDKIDTTKINAIYNNGILLLQLPKKAEVKPIVQQISIS